MFHAQRPFLISSSLDILTPADLTDTYLKMCLTYVIIRDLKIQHVKIKRKVN